MIVYWKIGKIVKLVQLLELIGYEGISKEFDTSFDKSF